MKEAAEAMKREVGETDDQWVECPVCGDDGREGDIRAAIERIEAEERARIAALIREKASDDWDTTYTSTWSIGVERLLEELEG
jgi:hypothetical protein